MQEYVNIDYSRVMSVVALTGEPDQNTIIAEARFVRDEQSLFGDLAFVVDEKHHGQGIATALYEMLIPLAIERGLKGFTAEVLEANKKMMKIFENGDLPINVRVKNGLYELTIPFADHPSQVG